jgi:hypothetical protein
MTGQLNCREARVFRGKRLVSLSHMAYSHTSLADGAALKRVAPLLFR